MIGILLLLLAIGLYIQKKKKYSLLIFLFSISGFFGLLPPNFLGIKNSDILGLYTYTICIYSYFSEPFYYKEDKNIKKCIKLLFVFLLFSVAFSFIHYKFSLYQIIQGGRSLFLFLSYFFLRKTRKEDVIWLFGWMYYLTLITSILYILEVVTGLPFLPSALDVDLKIDRTTGINRFYNSPIWLPLFIYVSILFPELIKKYKFHIIAPVIFLIAQIATLGRTEIGVVLFITLLGALIQGRGSKLFRYTMIIAICLIPFIDILMSRYGGTSGAGNISTVEDIQAIIRGDYKAMAWAGDMQVEGTMTYRFAWIYERMEYLSHRPFLENVFGLGMISDSQAGLVNKLYHFNIGLVDKRTEYVGQLATADIAYGNILTQFGYLGGVIYMTLWIVLIRYLYLNRRKSPYIFVLFLLALGYMFRSFSGNTISYTGTLCIFFLMMSMIPQIKKKYYNESCTH